MIDTSVAVPGEAACPYCDHRIYVAAILRLPGTWEARQWHCQPCGGWWKEIRDPLTVTRFWEPVPVRLAPTPVG